MGRPLCIRHTKPHELFAACFLHSRNRTNQPEKEERTARFRPSDTKCILRETPIGQWASLRDGFGNRSAHTPNRAMGMGEPHANATLTLTLNLLPSSGAVCSDGSPAGYYFRQGARSDLWHVHLGGGGFCYDMESCMKRCPPGHTGILCSSQDWADTHAATGILAPSSPFLRQASVAYVPLCSGDSYMSDSFAFGQHFRGARTVHAVLSDLVDRGLGGSSQRRHLLLFGGSSAGARGAAANLEYVPRMLGSAAPLVDIVGVLDSFVIEDAPLLEPPIATTAPRPTVLPFAEQFRRFTSHVAVSRPGGWCANHYPTETWRCLFGVNRLPAIEVPYLLMATQYDRFQLSNNVGGKLGPDATADPPPQAYSYAERWAGVYRALARNLTRGGSGRAVLSWACYNHAISLTDAGFRGANVGGVTMQDATLRLLFGATDGEAGGDSGAESGAAALPTAAAIKARPSLLFVDDCSSFDCGAGCHAGAAEPPASLTLSTLASPVRRDLQYRRRARPRAAAAATMLPDPADATVA